MDLFSHVVSSVASDVVVCCVVGGRGEEEEEEEEDKGNCFESFLSEIIKKLSSEPLFLSN